MPIAAEVVEDALQILRVAGRDGSNFTFEYVPYPRLGCGSGPPPADVIVTNTATGVKHGYAVRPGAPWLSAFDAHVAAGLYWP